MLGDVSQLNTEPKLASYDGETSVFAIMERRNQRFINHTNGTSYQTWGSPFWASVSSPDHSYSELKGLARAPYWFIYSHKEDTPDDASSRNYITPSQNSHNGPTMQPQFGEVAYLRTIYKRDASSTHTYEPDAVTRFDLLVVGSNATQDELDSQGIYNLSNGVWSRTSGSITYTIARVDGRWEFKKDDVLLHSSTVDTPYPWKIDYKGWYNWEPSRAYGIKIHYLRDSSDNYKVGFEIAKHESWTSTGTVDNAYVKEIDEWMYPNNDSTTTLTTNALRPLGMRFSDQVNVLRLGDKTTNKDRTSGHRTQGGDLYFGELIYYPSDQTNNLQAIDANIKNQYEI
jgi:hypothetical protein